MQSGDWTGYCVPCYNKTREKEDPIYFLSRKYDEIQQRCERPRSESLMKYKGMSFCSRKELVNKFKKSRKFHKLFQTWKDSGWEYNLHPSVDRIDSKKGYTIDNLQFITFAENSLKDRAYTKTIDAYTIGGRYIGNFPTRFVLAKKLNIPQEKIWACLYGTIKTTYGYKFKWNMEIRNNEKKSTN